MAQDRFSEGGRSIVWRAVMDTLNGRRRESPLAQGLFIKFEAWRGTLDPWKPGDPDDVHGRIREDEIQALIADIAVEVCRRVEEALDAIDPPKPAKAVSATDKAKSRWVGPGVLCAEVPMPSGARLALPGSQIVREVCDGKWECRAVHGAEGLGPGAGADPGADSPRAGPGGDLPTDAG